MYMVDGVVCTVKWNGDGKAICVEEFSGCYGDGGC